MEDMKKKNVFEQKIRKHIFEMLNKIAPGARLVIPVFGGKDYYFEKSEIVEAMMKIAKRRSVDMWSPDEEKFDEK